jgi:hypothetical protein
LVQNLNPSNPYILGWKEYKKQKEMVWSFALLDHKHPFHTLKGQETFSKARYNLSKLVNQIIIYISINVKKVLISVQAVARDTKQARKAFQAFAASLLCILAILLSILSFLVSFWTIPF